jgi:transitional endoplasmic reticulum ATPase
MQGIFMAGDEQTIHALKMALGVSPENVPLRKHLADTLTAYGRHGEAEKEYRQALSYAPMDVELLLALAHCFFRQMKHSESMVIVEGMATGPKALPKARMLYARLLHKAGNDGAAATHYKKAVEEDATLADETLAEELGVGQAGQGKWQEEPAVVSPDGRIKAPGQEPEARATVEFERPKINFSDVGGMEQVKEQIRLKIIHPLKHPEVYKAYGKKIGGGILMYGPPGCGKTHLARATAGEVQAGFMSIGIHDVLDMWLGNSEKQLHVLFDKARRAAPSVLFFDEVDALGASRTDMRASAGRHLINQFLSELDGVSASNEGVLILAATNAPWHLDSAFRRPGRFDRVIFVPPPDVTARAETLKLILAGKPLDDVDYAHVAKKTEHFSGADLKAVVDVAIEGKLAEAMKRGVPSPITTKDLVAAAKNVKPSTQEWFATARNYALYANQGGIYDDIVDYMKLR